MRLVPILVRCGEGWYLTVSRYAVLRSTLWSSSSYIARYFGAPFDRDVAPGTQKTRYFEQARQKLVVVPPVELGLELGIDIGPHHQQSGSARFRHCRLLRRRGVGARRQRPNPITDPARDNSRSGGSSADIDQREAGLG